MRVVAVEAPGLAWIEARTGATLSRDARAIAAIDSKGSVRGMVAYDGWTENAAQMHVAFETPIACRSLLLPAFEYLFEQSGRGLALAVVSAANPRSLAFTKSLGFVETHRIRDGHKIGVDLICHEMRREACAWIQQERQAA